jgi:predicted AlkP superfamily phosphohydrolase/phosphomutase
VLAVSIESAEPQVVRRLMARGEMPVLSRLAQRSAWVPLAPEPYIGSVAQWPSIASGLRPEQHRRLYGPWLWDPEQMRIAPHTPEPITPLWTRSGAASIGIFDVPWVEGSATPGGFLVRGWGSHNPMDHELVVAPREAAELLGERHPYECANEINYKSGDRVRELTQLSTDSLRGIQMRGAAAQRLLRRFRPELAFVNFPELHRAGHWLWHTLEPDDRQYASLPDAVRSMPVGVAELYRETDRQVGVLIDEAGPDADVFVFAFNGMEPANGVPDFLRSVLVGTGYAQIAKLRTAALPRRALAALKARTPARIKQAYYARLPAEITLRLAELLPDYDWSATRAFAMPSEQHGWIRLNVAGREAAGVVAPRDFERVGDELEAMLRSLTSQSGEPVVQDVVRIDADNVLPDLVVHWAAAAHSDVARLDGQQFSAPPVLPWLVGKHSMKGFCLAPEQFARGRDRVVPAELQELVLAPLA